MQVVLVTGASTGIGRALIHILASTPSYKVIATARKESLGRFSEHISPNVEYRSLNVVSKEERVSLINEIEEKFGGVTILINNAGVSFRSSIEDISENEELLQMSTNYFAPMELIKLSLPSIRRNKGRIINISSVSGMMAMPTMGSYSASKFALEGASESLWYELRPWKIPITLIEPGFVRSNSHEHVLRSEKSLTSKLYEPMYQEMERFVAGLMKRAFATPESVAECIVRVMKMKNPPIRVLPSFDAQFFFYLRRFTPRRIYHSVLYAMIPHIKKLELHALHNP